MRYTGPKGRRVRRHGMNLYGVDKYDKILSRKPNAPGKGARAQYGKQSEYSVQLREKQKARDMYGLSERQFHRTYLLATKVRGQTGSAFKQMLERRLDNVIYRAGFARTRMQSRQFVSHGLFAVKDRRVTVPSFLVRPGDIIIARERAKASPVFVPILEAHSKYLPPSWMKVNQNNLTIEITDLPPPDSFEQAVDMRQIIEFYSR